MDKHTSVALWGLGAMGTGMARMILRNELLSAYCAVSDKPGHIGRDLGEVVGVEQKTGVIIGKDPAQELARPEAEVVLIATTSFTEQVFPQIRLAIEHGLNVITIAEEMAYPYYKKPEIARQIDRLAKQNGVSVLGTGVNPGFVLDTLVICLTGVCSDISYIKAVRVNDLAPFGPTVMNTQGVGKTEEEFREGVEQGSIVGHVGFAESMSMIADALGWKLDSIEEMCEPIISNVERVTEHVRVQPGMVAGCRHSARARIRGEIVLEMEHPQQVLPEAEGVKTGDYINIEGNPSIDVRICPEIPGGIGTCAIALNMIPAVINARPGLLTMADLPVPRALVGRLCKAKAF